MPTLDSFRGLLAPPGIGAVQAFSRRHITIGEDRIVEMSAEDAKYLIRGMSAEPSPYPDRPQ